MNNHQLVIEHLPLAATITGGIMRRLPRHPAGFMDAEDLQQDARVGLLQAAAKYDARKAVPFGAYARRRIRGAVRDSLRRNDHLTRDSRAKLKASGAEDSSAPVPLLEPDLLRSKDAWPDTDATDQETRRLLTAAISRLPFRLHVLMLAYYYEGQHMREIGQRLGVNESRVSQLHRRALSMLQRYFQIRGIGMEAFQA